MEKNEFMKDCKGKKSISELLLGDLVVRIPGFHGYCHGPGSIPLQETEIPQAAQHLRITSILGTRAVIKIII